MKIFKVIIRGKNYGRFFTSEHIMTASSEERIKEALKIACSEEIEYFEPSIYFLCDA